MDLFLTYISSCSLWGCLWLLAYHAFNCATSIHFKSTSLALKTLPPVFITTRVTWGRRAPDGRALVVCRVSSVPSPLVCPEADRQAGVRTPLLRRARDSELPGHRTQDWLAAGQARTRLRSPEISGLCFHTRNWTFGASPSLPVAWAIYTVFRFPLSRVTCARLRR